MENISKYDWIKQLEGKTIKEIKVGGYSIEFSFYETDDLLYVEGEHEYVGIEARIYPIKD